MSRIKDFNILTRKVVDDFETERDLPTFQIDVNGFLLFDDPELGGIGIFEVIPATLSEGYTHIDSINPYLSTDSNRAIEQTLKQVDDTRSDLITFWVYFLNKLLSKTKFEENLNIQIIAKKCLSNEWGTNIDWYVETSKEQFNEFNNWKGITNQSPFNIRQNDYIDLLNNLQNKGLELETAGLNPYRLRGYITKFFLCIPYTPSTEGWWEDGRDSTYYISDTKSNDTLFSVDTLVEKIASFRYNREKKKKEKISDVNPDDIGSVFRIESDKTVSVIETRMKRVEHIWEEACSKINYTPAYIERLSDRETAALVRFYPNILSSYVKKIWDLHPDYNAVFYDLDTDISLNKGDTNFFTEKNIENIINGNPDFSIDTIIEEKFLEKYKDYNINKLRSVDDEQRELIEKEKYYNKLAKREQEQEKVTNKKLESIWKGLDSTLTLENPSQDIQEEDFLKKYKHRSVSSEVRATRNALLEQQKDQTSTNPFRLRGTANKLSGNKQKSFNNIPLEALSKLVPQESIKTNNKLSSNNNQKQSQEFIKQLTPRKIPRKQSNQK